METTKAWLAAVSWDKVMVLNQALCKSQDIEFKTTHALAASRQVWEKQAPGKKTLIQALEVLQRCNELRPFVYNCSSVFTSLAKSLVEDWANELGSVEAHILRTTAAHFVDAQVHHQELRDILKYLETRPRRSQPSGPAEAQLLPPVQQRQLA